MNEEIWDAWVRRYPPRFSRLPYALARVGALLLGTFVR